MSETTDTPETPAGGPAPRRPRRGLLVAGAAVVIAGAGAGIGYAVGGSHSSSSAPAAATTTPSLSPTTIELDGTITVPFAGSSLFAPQATDPNPDATAGAIVEDTCLTVGGFTDISQGVAVNVGDSTGKTVGVGALDAGKVIGQQGQPASCQFSFEVEVPADLSEYTVTISHRGTQVFTADQVAAGQVQLTLG